MKYALAMVTAIALGSSATQAHSLKELEDQLIRREAYVEFVERPAPPFSLRDDTGGAVALADFAGKVVVLNFLYTNCPDVCPLQSALIANLQAHINRAARGDMVRFITITTDPERDTPAVMRAYGAAQGLDRATWSFLTTDDEDGQATRTLARDYGLKFTPGDDGYLLHGVVTHVIDRYGTLRARYHGLRVDPESIIDYINALATDSH